MDIFHITEDNSKSNFGVTTVVKELNHRLLIEKNDSKIISPIVDISDNYTIYTKPSLQSKIWKHSIELKRFLNKIDIGILHIHGVWMYPQYIASKVAYYKKHPSVLTPHGMLEPWLWNNSYLKKKIYFNLFIKKYFRNISTIHAITDIEKNNLFNLFKHKNIHVIPNSISLNKVKQMEIKNTSDEKYILFLGRLHSKKGIDLLIKAFSMINNSNIKLKIAGPINEYKEELDRLVNSLGLEDKVEFLGSVNGVKKFELYKNAWVFVAPSHSEVVGMVNLEAAAVKTPVITTYETGLMKEWNDNGGVLIHPKVDVIKLALIQCLSWSNEERNDRGNKLYDFIYNNYSWEKNIYKWIELYRSLC